MTDLEESKTSIDYDRSMTNVNMSKDTSNVHINTNPLDVANDNVYEKPNWYCCFGQYENGIISCKIPKIEKFSQNQVEYNVDISINGQQFSGFPMIYRFYGKNF